MYYDWVYLRRKVISPHKKTGIIRRLSCYCTRRLLYSAISPASLILANRSSDRNHIADNNKGNGNGNGDGEGDGDGNGDGDHHGDDDDNDNDNS